MHQVGLLPTLPYGSCIAGKSQQFFKLSDSKLYTIGNSFDKYVYFRVRQITFFFFGKYLKKLLNIFSNFVLYLKVQSFRLIMENNFIQMAALAGLAVAYMVDPTCKHIMDCVQLYFTNGFTNTVL